MILTARRLIVIVGCLLYAGACAALATSATSQRETVWVLWMIVIAHVIFGAESLLQCFSDDPQKGIDQLQTELEAERRERVILESRIADLERITNIRNDRVLMDDSGNGRKEMID